MAENIELNGYELSRRWFNFCFENPEKIVPNHTAVYFFAIEHCNRLGWKSKFGLPTSMVMEAVGIKSYNTYKKTLLDLVEFGFIKMIEVSKNQYSSNIVALSFFNKAQDKALDKALIKHTSKQSESTAQSIDSIDKQITKEQKNNEPIGDKSPTQKSFKNFSEKEFIEEIKNYEQDFSKQMLNNFFLYWKERSAAGKMKFQLEKTWETKLRLEKWKSNDLKFNKNGNTSTSPTNKKSAGAYELAEQLGNNLGILR